MTTRREFLIRSAVAAGAFALPALHARAATAINIGYTAVPDFGAAFIAKQKGFFDKRGIDASLQMIALTSNVPAAVMANSVHIGGTTPTVFLQAVENGLDLVGIAAGSAHAPSMNAIGIVAKAGGEVRTPADLVGRKLGIPGMNGTLHVMARRWLKQQGIDTAKVTFIEVPLPRMDAVLVSGNVDAVVTVEPFVGRMVGNKIGTALPGFAQAFPEGIATCLFVATREWAAANAGAVKEFRAALAEGATLAKSDQATARSNIGQYFKVPDAVLAAMPMPDLQSNVTVNQLKFWVEAMHEQGMLKKQPNLASLIA